MSTIRLFVDARLEEGGAVVLEREQAHYLFTVMRLAPGAELLVFDGRNGEWAAEVVEAGKRRGRLRLTAQTRPQTAPPDIELIFAPIKKARTDFIVEKACEMGCARVTPVFTRHTNSERLNLSRLRAHMIEAAEQCGGLSVPELGEPTKLPAVLDTLHGRRAIFCDESREAPEIAEALRGLPRGTPVSVLIGPEGGFADEERAAIRRVPGAVPVRLGPRILRADTAAVAALALVQAALGDWS